MDRPQIIFNAVEDVNPSLPFGVDGIPLWLIVSGLVIGQFLTVQKRVDGMTLNPIWADYYPKDILTMNSVITRLPIFRPGYYRLVATNINLLDPVQVVLTRDQNTDNKSPIVAVPVGLN